MKVKTWRQARDQPLCSLWISLCSTRPAPYLISGPPHLLSELHQWPPHQSPSVTPSSILFLTSGFSQMQI